MKVTKKQAKDLMAGKGKFGAVFPKAPLVGAGVKAQVVKKAVKAKRK